jgi:hypothetical protein
MVAQDDIRAAIDRAKLQLVERFQQQPNDFYTEGDLSAYLVHRLYAEFKLIGIERTLAHLEYPTPFRCDMGNGSFCVKVEDDRTARGRRFRRGHFDVTVFNPAFVDECSANFMLRKGQRWELLRPMLEQRRADSEPVALFIFELMYIRDPFLRGLTHKRGQGKLMATLRDVTQDWAKLCQVLQPDPRGFVFSRAGAMLLFDNGLPRPAAEKLRDGLPEEVEFHSTALQAC